MLVSDLLERADLRQIIRTPAAQIDFRTILKFQINTRVIHEEDALEKLNSPRTAMQFGPTTDCGFETDQ